MTANRSREASLSVHSLSSAVPVQDVEKLLMLNCCLSFSVTGSYIANATGCSSIYGGNLPTTPYTKRDDGRGPTWNNSLFEDNAEVALGMRLSVDKFNEYAKELTQQIIADGSCSTELKNLLGMILSADQSTQELIEMQRVKVAKAKEELAKVSSATAKELLSVIDYLVKKSVWLWW